MFAEPRLRTMLFLLSLLAAAGTLTGCSKDKAHEATNKQGALNGDAVKQSLEGLKPKLSALTEKFKALHKQIDPLPPNLPGFSEVRAKFYNTDIGMGILAPKITWLSERLDSALKSGNREELQQVSKDIAKTHDEITQIDGIALEVLHQVVPFQRILAQRAAEAVPRPPSFTRRLSTGHEVKADAGGLEQHLLEFVDDPKQKVDKNTWFDFDRVQFVGVSAELDTEASVAQLGTLSEILKAYPTVALKIGAFTDNTGPATANKKSSDQRAQTVKAALVRLGVPASRLSAGGYGAEHPLCAANDTAECKAKNRRVAARVTAK